jgi:hypothetical protein
MNNSSIINSIGWLRIGEVPTSSIVLTAEGNVKIMGWLFSYTDLVQSILIALFGIAIIYILIKISQNQRKEK